MAKYLVEIVIKGTDLASSEFRKVKQEAEGVDKALKVTAASTAAVGVAIATGLAVAAREGAKYADTLGDISNRTGFSISTTAALGQELEKAGEGFGSLDTVARTLTQTMQRAVAGEESARKTFDDLGISLDTLTAPGGGLVSVEELLPRIADGLASMESPAARAATGVDLLGRGSLALVPILSKGREGLAAFREETERLSGGLDPEKILNAGALDDSLKDLGQSFRGFQVTVASGAGLDKYVDSLASAVSAVNRFSQEHEDVTKVLLLTAGVIAGGGGLIIAVGSLANAYKALGAAGLIASGGLRAALVSLGTASGVIAVAGGIALAAQGIADSHKRQEDATRNLDEATKDFGKTLADEKSTVDQVAAAYERLRSARTEQARVDRKETARGTPGGLFDFGLGGSGAAAERAGAEMDKENAAVVEAIRRRLAGRQRMIEGLAQSETGEIVLPPVEVDQEVQFQLRVVRGEATARELIEHQKQVIADIESQIGTTQIRLQSEVAGTEGHAKAEKELTDLRKKRVDESIRLAQIQEEISRGAKDEAAALREIAAAGQQVEALKGNLDISAQIQAATVEVARLEAALVDQKAAVDATASTTGDHANAIDELTSTYSQLLTVLETLSGLEEQEVQRQRELIAATAQRESALQRLARVEQRLRIITTVEGEDERDKQLKTLELQDAAAGVREAQLAFAVGPLDLTQQQAAIDNLAASLERYEGALVSAQGAQIDTSESSAGLGIALDGAATVAQGAIASIGEESVDAGALFKRAVTGMISDLIRLVLQALTVKKIIAGFSSSFNPLGFMSFFSFQGGGEPKGFQSGGEPAGYAVTYETPLRMQGGGKAGRITSGMRGIDSVPAFVGKGELMVDHSTTDELKSFLSRARMSSSLDFQRAVGSGGVASRRQQSPDFGAVVSELKRIASPSVEGGQSRTVQVFYQPGYSVASSAEEARLFSHLSDGLGTFERDGIAKQAVK